MAYSTAKSPFTKNMYPRSKYTYLVAIILKSESELN